MVKIMKIWPIWKSDAAILGLKLLHIFSIAVGMLFLGRKASETAFKYYALRSGGALWCAKAKYTLTLQGPLIHLTFVILCYQPWLCVTSHKVTWSSSTSCVASQPGQTIFCSFLSCETRIPVFIQVKRQRTRAPVGQLLFNRLETSWCRWSYLLILHVNVLGSALYPQSEVFRFSQKF